MITMKPLPAAEIPIVDEGTLALDVRSNFRSRRSCTSGPSRAAMNLVRSGHDLVVGPHVGNHIGVLRRARLIEMVASDALANDRVIVTNPHRGELGAGMPSLFLILGISRTDLLTGAAP